ncbi:hypothetical protein RHGRI_012334 [Rhododendron griersonianum]|uniref:Survival protein SurE-like phosphatase/nucleotidase domain-containing protein n=1 Tax=Rhododendron griersonianum TaxID=479676 RepID=A0AAV6KQ08_9ERIC|nr:hypothetical protein RHGRI_012334 [Rhododendron griersonianum]
MLSVPEDVSVDPNSMGLKRGIVRNECQEFIGTPSDCTSLGVSGSLFPSTPDLVALSLLLLYENVNDFITLGLYPRVYLHIVWYRSVISGINMGSNCGYHIVYSGTVAGAREAFFNGVPALSLSYEWVGGTSNVDDYTLAAEACLPIVNAMLAEIKNKTYPQKCFLNVDLPTNVASHKGYKLTKQGKSIVKMGWKQVTSAAQGGKMLSTMTMETNSLTSSEMDASTMPKEHRLFKREVRGAVVDEDDTDYRSLQEGYITVTPLGALSHADIECQAYFKDWLPGVAECFSSSTL